MRWPRVGGPRRLSPVILVVLAFWTLALWAFLPYDNAIVLFVRFTSHRLLSLLRQPLDPDGWLQNPARFPVDLDRDVSFVIKTGYGTQPRLPAQLDALELRPENTLVIADYAASFPHNGHLVQVHDAMAMLMRSDALAGLAGSERLVQYANMTAAIEAGDREGAETISKSIGWQLDALKFIPALDMVYRDMPGRNWYMMVDDDTYILKPSLRVILDRLDPSRPVYLGNAVGDFKGRFAHGGSSFILSRAAMSRLFDGKRQHVQSAYVDSLTETWGDKLVATTLLKVGVYLEERYSRYFNGEPPRITRILADRFCSPILSFHGLADPKLMTEVGNAFRGIETPVVWGRLWNMYGQPDFDVFERNPIRRGQDHVGRTDESTMTAEGVESADDCREVCDRHYGSCLAWTWDKGTKQCHVSPWIIIGDGAPDRYSGLNVARAMKLMNQCDR